MSTPTPPRPALPVPLPPPAPTPAALGVDLEQALVREIAPLHEQLLPLPLGRRLRAAVLGVREDVVRVAVTDPSNLVTLDDLRVALRDWQVEVVEAPPWVVDELLSRRADATGSSARVLTQLRELARSEALAAGALDGVWRDEDGDGEADGVVHGLTGASEEPVSALLDLVLTSAVQAGASDVHIEPGASEVRVRLRVDGVLQELVSFPRAAGAELVARVKGLAGMDVSDRRHPQDGRSRVEHEGAVTQLRISVLPSLHGETLVMRLLPRAEALPLLTSAGLDERALAQLRAAVASSQGLVLVTGPTGSGKTSTLYAALREIHAPEVSISTLEDPVEIELPGLTQVPIRTEHGVSFASGLRALLRQDPDVVLVGEIRDLETAQLALQASLTGHLVLSTLHTNDAVSAVTRLRDMGADTSLLASSLSLVVAQRLLRTLCVHCRVPADAGSHTLLLERAGLRPHHLAQLRVGAGCAHCGGTGYRGRTGVFEVLDVSAMRERLAGGISEEVLRRGAAEAGEVGLEARAVELALAGRTSLQEALSQTSQGGTSQRRCRSCSHLLEVGMRFCPGCGVSVVEAGCEGCGGALRRSWAHCPACGAPSSAEGPGADRAAPRPR